MDKAAGQRPVEQQAYLDALESLQKLRSFNGEPARFWPQYIHHLVIAAGAAIGVLGSASSVSRFLKI